MKLKTTTINCTEGWGKRLIEIQFEEAKNLQSFLFVINQGKVCCIRGEGNFLPEAQSIVEKKFFNWLNDNCETISHI